MFFLIQTQIQKGNQREEISSTSLIKHRAIRPVETFPIQMTTPIFFSQTFERSSTVKSFHFSQESFSFLQTPDVEKKEIADTLIHMSQKTSDSEEEENNLNQPTPPSSCISQDNLTSLTRQMTLKKVQPCIELTSITDRLFAEDEDLMKKKVERKKRAKKRPQETEDEKLKRKRARNKVLAKESRDRRKERFKFLEDEFEKSSLVKKYNLKLVTFVNKLKVHLSEDAKKEIDFTEFENIEQKITADNSTEVNTESESTENRASD